MTAQQIEYWKLKEGERANQAAEAENRRYHMANEKLQSQLNAENARHNRASEAINRANLDIAARNAATNALNAVTNARLADIQRQRDLETQRHNLALESIDQSYKTNSLELEGKKLEQGYLIASEDREAANLRSYIGSGTGVVQRLVPGLLGVMVGKGLATGSAATEGAAVTGAATSSLLGGSFAGPLLGGLMGYGVSEYIKQNDLPYSTDPTGIVNVLTVAQDVIGNWLGRSSHGGGHSFETPRFKSNVLGN